MDTITTIAVYLGFSIVFMMAVFLLLWKRSVKRQAEYPVHWKRLKKALDLDHTVDIATYGSSVIWNENLKQEHKKVLYREVESRKDRPELQQLWKDVYYKTHGVEPM